MGCVREGKIEISSSIDRTTWPVSTQRTQAKPKKTAPPIQDIRNMTIHLALLLSPCCIGPKKLGQFLRTGSGCLRQVSGNPKQDACHPSSFLSFKHLEMIVLLADAVIQFDSLNLGLLFLSLKRFQLSKEVSAHPPPNLGPIFATERFCRRNAVIPSTSQTFHFHIPPLI